MVWWNYQQDRQEICDDVYDSSDGENWFVGTNKAWQKSPLVPPSLLRQKSMALTSLMFLVCCGSVANWPTRHATFAKRKMFNLLSFFSFSAFHFHVEGKDSPKFGTKVVLASRGKEKRGLGKTSSFFLIIWKKRKSCATDLKRKGRTANETDCLVLVFINDPWNCPQLWVEHRKI